jgi:dissimilatory sulfite reductase (desulfoviridin) alpha/beta subunit
MLAVPPLRFAAPHFIALRSGFFYLRAAPCTDSDACIDYIDCSLTCGTPACVDACSVSFPTGATLYGAIESCVYCGECTASCAGEFTCP